MNNLYNKIISEAEKYNNSKDLLLSIYGLDSNDHYDCIVIAPSWIPEKILKNYECEIICVIKHSYFSSYIVKYDDFKLAWVQCASGANNLIDTALTFGKCDCDKVVFLGAVGALKKDIKLGDIVTPKYSLTFEGGSLYTYEDININNFGKGVYPNNPEFISQVFDICRSNNISMKEKIVYCTDSIICEYLHLDKIKALGSELIEMETAAFYRCMKLMNKRGIALLCVSDNSTINISLIEKNEQETATFHKSREVNIPKILFDICKL